MTLNGSSDRPAIGAPEHWTEAALCWRGDIDPRSWDPEASPLDHARATLICARCPVAEQCLTEFGDDPHMIVAGLTPAARARIAGIPTLEARRSPHGTRSRYVGSSAHPGCRCPRCTAAHAAHEQEARARRKAEQAAGKRTA